VDEILIEMVNTLQFPAHADGPGDRRTTDFQDVLDLIQQFNRFAAIPVQLVDEVKIGVSRSRQTSISLMVRSSTPGAVNDHQRRIHSGQSAVGVLGKVLVAGVSSRLMMRSR